MKNTLIRNLVRPLFERLGTALAVWLVATGMDGEAIEQIVTAVTALLAVSADLIVNRMSRDR